MLNSISRKVVAGYAAILLLLALTTSGLFSKLTTIDEITDQFVGKSLPTIQGVKQASNSLNRLLIAAYGLYGYTIEQAEYKRTLESEFTAINRAIPIVTKSYPKARELDVQAMKAILEDFRLVMAQNDVDWDRARELLTQMQRQAQLMEQVLSRAEKAVTASANTKVHDISTDIDSMLLWLSLSIISIALITVLAFLMAKKTIVKPVKSLSRQLDKIVEDLDLRQDVVVDTKDEVAITAKSVNQLLAASRKVNGEIANSANVLQESIELLNHSANLSDEQIIHLSTTVDALLLSVGQVQSSIADTASRSNVASTMATTGAEQVEQGSDNIKQTANIISELSADIDLSAEMLLNLKQAGDKVSSVVKTIAEIAEQTNLLALNAAIEAARAGESGRGFAVVAGEVRTLASRTHDSTYEINSILEEIVSSISSTVGSMEVNKQKANEAVTAAETTVVSLSEIKQTVLTLSDENQQLAELGQASQDDMTQMRVNIDGISESVERVTETSQETKQASTSLAQLVSGLYQLLNQFKT